MRPAATSSCMRATEAGAARNSGRRCTCTMLSPCRSGRAPSRARNRRRRRSPGAGRGNRTRCARGSGSACPRSASAPSTPSRRGWNEPRPAAITTAFGDEARARGRGQVEAAVLARAQLDHLLAEVEFGPERLDLLQQPVDQLLGAAHRQRRDVVDRLVRIQLGALAARVLQRVDDVGLDAEQPQLERPGTAPPGPRR